MHVWELCCSSSIPAAPWHRVGLAQPWAGDVTLWGAQGAQQGRGLSLSLVATSTTLPAPQNATFVPSAVEPRGGPWHCHPQGKGHPRAVPKQEGTVPREPPHHRPHRLFPWRIPAPLPAARAGLECLLRSCEELRELALAKGHFPPPSMGPLCAAGEAESNYRQSPKTASPPAPGASAALGNLLCEVLFCFSERQKTPSDAAAVPGL